MPAPVRIVCCATLSVSASRIAEGILDLDQWMTFPGWGPLPGIRSAKFIERTGDIVGTRIGVENRDGSRHVEEIVEWDPPRMLRLRLCEFSKPLAYLATAFDETWSFDECDGGTRVERIMLLHPRSAFTRPILIVIGWMLRRALLSHMDMIDES